MEFTEEQLKLLVYTLDDAINHNDFSDYSPNAYLELKEILHNIKDELEEIKNNRFPF